MLLVASPATKGVEMKRMKKPEKKLTLDQETLRKLDDAQLQQVNGGQTGSDSDAGGACTSGAVTRAC